MVAWSQSGAAAETPPVLARHAIYASGGVGVLWFAADLSYELRLIAFQSSFWNDLRLKLSGGRFGEWGYSGTMATARLGVVVGRRNHHLEAGAGAMALLDDLTARSFAQRVQFRPAGYIGYRFQVPGKPSLVLRLGVGFPDGAYLGAGIGF